MARLQSIFADYLYSVGRLGPVHLGEGDESEARKQLAIKLSGTATSNNYFVVIATTCLCILFVMVVFFVFYYRDDAKTVAVIFAAILSNFGIIRWLRQLYIEKSLVDMAMIALHDWTPAQATDLISLVYQSLSKQPLEKSSPTAIKGPK